MPKGPNPYADMEPTEEAPYGWTKGDDGNPRPRMRPAPYSRRRHARTAPEDLTPEEYDDPDHAPEGWESPAEPELDQDPEPRRGDGFIKAATANTRRTVRVTPGVRKDIKAKTALMLGLPAAVASRRDPVCGPVLMEQVPEIADALTDIFCDSPDIVQFFTSGAGGYMKWLKLMTAVQPVVEVGFKHHVTHSIKTEEKQRGGAPDWSRYAAPAVP